MLVLKGTIDEVLKQLKAIKNRYNDGILLKTVIECEKPKSVLDYGDEKITINKFWASVFDREIIEFILKRTFNALSEKERTYYIEKFKEQNEW